MLLICGELGGCRCFHFCWPHLPLFKNPIFVHRTSMMRPFILDQHACPAQARRTGRARRTRRARRTGRSRRRGRARTGRAMRNGSRRAREGPRSGNGKHGAGTIGVGGKRKATGGKTGTKMPGTEILGGRTPGGKRCAVLDKSNIQRWLETSSATSGIQHTFITVEYLLLASCGYVCQNRRP